MSKKRVARTPRVEAALPTPPASPHYYFINTEVPTVQPVDWILHEAQGLARLTELIAHAFSFNSPVDILEGDDELLLAVIGGTTEHIKAARERLAAMQRGDGVDAG